MTDRLILRHRTQDKRLYQRRPGGSYYILEFDVDGAAHEHDVKWTRWGVDKLRHGPDWEDATDEGRLPV